MNRQDRTDNNQLGKALEVINNLDEKSVGGDYIYRGEPKHYEKVSSSLYRKFQKIEAEGFDIEVVQKEILKEVLPYTEKTDELEILSELQHNGYETNLIDCTTDIRIALFFACNGVFDEDGRVILLRKLNDENKTIRKPWNPGN